MPLRPRAVRRRSNQLGPVGRDAGASVVVDRKLEILFSSGPTDDYLRGRGGWRTQGLYAMARPGLRAALRDAVKRALRDGHGVLATARVKRNRRLQDVEIMVAPLEAAHSRDSLLLVSFRDRLDVVAAADQAAGPLPMAQGLGDALFESAPTAIAIVDVEGRIVSINAQMQELFGYGRGELVGRSVEILVPDELRTGHASHRAAYLAWPEIRRMGAFGREIMAIRKDGTRVPVEIALGPIQTAEGLLTAAHVIDISARKAAEGALRKAQEELERRVLERTGELRASNERLSALSGHLLKVQDDERRRIAQELHDSTGQHLAGVLMNLAVVRRAAGQLGAPAQDALADSVALVEQCAGELRTLSYLLHPPLLDDRGLEPAVRWYAEGFAKRSGIKVDVTVTRNLPRMAPAIEQALFRIVQECLGNVHRHAGCRAVRVEIQNGADVVTLRVVDDGRGIPPDTLQAFVDGEARIGMGLVGMRERVEQLGGRFEIDSSGVGTTVQAVIPLAGHADPSGVRGRHA